MKKINAEHIECIPGAEPGIRREFSSLTLRIRQRAILRDMKSVNGRIRDIFGRHESMHIDIESLKIAGLIRIPTTQIGVTIVASSPLATEAHIFESIAKHIKEIMTRDRHYGNTAGLRIGLLADTSPESEAAVVWHTYKQPEDQ